MKTPLLLTALVWPNWTDAPDVRDGGTGGASVRQQRCEAPSLTLLAGVLLLKPVC
jgi:hypothetical protein